MNVTDTAGGKLAAAIAELRDWNGRTRSDGGTATTYFGLKYERLAFKTTWGDVLDNATRSEPDFWDRLAGDDEPMHLNLELGVGRAIWRLVRIAEDSPPAVRELCQLLLEQPAYYVRGLSQNEAVELAAHCHADGPDGFYYECIPRPVDATLLAEIERAAATQAPDGPVEPHGFRWNGKTYRIQPIPHRLLLATWGRHSRPLAEVEIEVWGDTSDRDSRIKSAVNKLNDALLQAGYNRELRRSAGKVFWD